MPDKDECIDFGEEPVDPVLRPSAIRAENGAILFCHGGDKEPALDQEFLSGPRRFLLGGNVGEPTAWICVRMGKKLSGLSGSIVTVMQPWTAIDDGSRNRIDVCSLPSGERCERYPSTRSCLGSPGQFLWQIVECGGLQKSVHGGGLQELGQI